MSIPVHVVIEAMAAGQTQHLTTPQLEAFIRDAHRIQKLPVVEAHPAKGAGVRGGESL